MTKLFPGQFELPCFDGRKSFYGKAVVSATADCAVLRSYATDVAVYNAVTNSIMLINNHCSLVRSRTTKRHIASFARFYGVSKEALEQAYKNAV